MAVPKRKTSKTRKAKRRFHFNKIKTFELSLCTNCQNYRKNHFICDSCGFYNEKQVVQRKIIKK